MRSRLVFSALVLAVALLAACTDNNRTSQPELVSVPNFVGRNAIGATDLAERHGLKVEIKAGSADPVGKLPDSVRSQEPPMGTQVPTGTTITLLLSSTIPVEPGERPFTLNTHCGLSYPLMFAGKAWLPTDKKLRRTINPPEEFGDPNSGSDHGTIRRVDKDTLIFTASNGFKVEYEPTDKRVGGCA